MTVGRHGRVGLLTAVLATSCAGRSAVGDLPGASAGPAGRRAPAGGDPGAASGSTAPGTGGDAATVGAGAPAGSRNRISFRVEDGDRSTPLVGVEACAFEGPMALEACRHERCDGSRAIAPCARTDATGAAALDVPAGRELVVILQQAGFEGVAYPFRVPAFDTLPFTASMFTVESTVNWYRKVGATYDGEHGELAIAMVGAVSGHVAGVEVGLEPPSGDTYYGTDDVHVDPTLTRSTSVGWAAALGVTPGRVSVHFDHATLVCATISTRNLGWESAAPETLTAPALPGFLTRVEMRCR